MLIERIYEDNVLGKISDDRFYRMSANYEKEQKELLAAVKHDEQKVREAEQIALEIRKLDFNFSAHKITSLYLVAPFYRI